MSELSDYFREQARWREEQAERFPDDERNAQSARALSGLADFVDETEEATMTIAALEDHVSDDGGALGGTSTQREVARYGYGYATTEWTHIDLLEELFVTCLVDVYDYAMQHGEDWTDGALFDFEVEAARGGVELSEYYFRRRGKSTEQESEAAVAEFVADHEAEEGE